MSTASKDVLKRLLRGTYESPRINLEQAAQADTHTEVGKTLVEFMFEKAARLSKTEIALVNESIQSMQKRGVPSFKIISAIQKQNPKLSERWKAERAYWTAVKYEDTQKVGEAGWELDFDKYRVILSPNACSTCIKKTDDGKKLFKNSDIAKSGFGHVPPFHPNCYCIMIPVE